MIIPNVKKIRESEIKSSKLKAIAFQKRREVERKFIDKERNSSDLYWSSHKIQERHQNAKPQEDSIEKTFQYFFGFVSSLNNE